MYSLWTGCRLLAAHARLAVARWHCDRLERRMVAKLEPGPILVDGQRIGRVVEITRGGRLVKKIVMEKEDG